MNFLWRERHGKKPQPASRTLGQPPADSEEEARALHLFPERK